MSTGHDLRAAGIADNLPAATAPHRPYREAAEDALDRLINTRQPFTSDDVRRAVRGELVAHSDNVLPSILGCAAKAGRIVRVTDIAAQRRSRHGSRIGVWVGRAA